ncbi:hypothetical protein KUTeg_003176 [Tegillarca granosa]|uniref:Sodium-coupled monocarboxylate transporter 2 n=1 Tax=Tegillarca granosa TaxID=220873 RepID=A0ABQ9FPA2_TEGGR|nr:hypothetical protein KUTeg_003176 [Tegillarca granosa]
MSHSEQTMSSEMKYSFQTGETHTFSVVDYVLFALMLVVSAAIGLFYAIKDRRRQNTNDFLMAGGNMHAFPVALSLLASFMSAITLLGTPAEMYNYTTMYWWIGLSYLFVVFGAAHIFLPVFYRLKVTSAYELLYMALVLYAPSLALNAVTGFTLWGSVISVGVVCTLYTTIGGMKAVLWTDTFQVGMMFAGLLAVLIRGSIEIGGFGNAWEKAYDSGRVVFDDFSPDPIVRHSVWSLVIGGTFTWVAIYGVNQAQVQRCCTCPTLKKAQIAMWLNFPGLCLILYFSCLIGIVVYGLYSQCDPFTFKLVQTSDQGYLWLVFSAELSVLVFGVACLGLTYIASLLGGVLQAALKLFGMIGGPLLGVFILGMIFPWANEWGAYTGLISGLALMFWIGIGSEIYKPNNPKSPISTAGCNWNLTTTTAMTTSMTSLSTMQTTFTDQFYNNGTDIIESNPLQRLYSLSYIWFSATAVLWVVGIGLIVSFITGRRKPEEIDPKLMCPLFDILFPYLPEKIRKPFRFGVKFEKYKNHSKYYRLKTVWINKY